MNFKKILPIVTAGIFALGFTACGDSESTSAPGNETPEVTPTDSIPTPADSIPTDTVPADTNKQVTPVRTDTTPSAEIPPTTGIGVLVDDFEDGDGGTFIGTGWYTYDDNDNDGANFKAQIHREDLWDLMIPQDLSPNDDLPALEIAYHKGDENDVTRVTLPLNEIKDRSTNQPITVWNPGIKYHYDIELRIGVGIVVTVTTTPWEVVEAQTPGLMI